MEAFNFFFKLIKLIMPIAYADNTGEGKELVVKVAKETSFAYYFWHTVTFIILVILIYYLVNSMLKDKYILNNTRDYKNWVDAWWAMYYQSILLLCLLYLLWLLTPWVFFLIVSISLFAYLLLPPLE